ncbi:glycoside hydrolase family protein [Acinetobacter sp. HY1485]|uniref:glycoside hydrolase family protein n=1 Tax=Acinetobacter sp. HY1485 TaxID=2970918 RepID=UPI0022B9C9F4|nr:glycoside hydrolase family protein [Acinetobacter sp. HY1485]
MSSHNKQKIAVGILAASLGFFGLVKEKEGFTSKPVVPTKGDVPTIGHGTTVYPNGVSVTLHDRPITRATADHYLRQHVSKTERQLKNSIPKVALSQTEYDVYLDFVYQYGIGAFNKSSMRTNLLQRQYTQACRSLLQYRYVAKRDCKVRSNNCYGVYTRQLERYKKCIGENQ